MSRSVGNGGDWSTVNVGPVAADSPYEQHSVSGYRQIIDLSPANDSRFADAVGESGHFLSKHYDDFLAGWQGVRHRPMRMDRTEIEKGAIGTLRLTVDSSFLCKNSIKFGSVLLMRSFVSFSIFASSGFPETS